MLILTREPVGLPRPGWNDAKVRIATNAPGPTRMVACASHPASGLCVHRLQGPDGDLEGWTITHEPTGMRLESRGRVFKNCAAAQLLVEAAHELRLADDWGEFFLLPKDDPLFQKFKDLHDAAEAIGCFISGFAVPCRPAAARGGGGVGAA